MNQKELGVRIRAVRNAMGLSLRGAAEATGIKEVVLGSYERGDRNPNIEQAARWVEAFGHQLVVIGPGESVIANDPSGEEYLSFAVIYGPDRKEIECGSEAEAIVLSREIPNSEVGYRINRRGRLQKRDLWESL